MSALPSALAFAVRSGGRPIVRPRLPAHPVLAIRTLYPSISTPGARVLEVMRHAPGAPLTLEQIAGGVIGTSYCLKTARCALSALPAQLREAGLAGALFHKHGAPHWILERGAAHLINGQLALCRKDFT